MQLALQDIQPIREMSDVAIIDIGCMVVYA
jgi:hypothetical protein